MRGPPGDCRRDVPGVRDRITPASRLRPAPPLVEPKSADPVLAVEVVRRVGDHPPADRWPRPQGPSGPRWMWEERLLADQRHWGRQHWLAPLLAQHQQVSGHTAAAVVLGRRAFGHSARRRPQASPGVTTPDQGIEAAGQPADVESYPVECAGMAGTGCEGRSKFRRREGNHNSGARPETATATLAASRSGKTARPDRVSLIGTP